MVTCTEDGRVARTSGAISAPAVGLAVVLHSAIRVAVRGRLVKRVPLVLTVSPFPLLFTVGLFPARRQLNVLRLSVLPLPFGPMLLLFCFQDGAIWQEVLDAPALLTPHENVCVPGSCMAMLRPATGLELEGYERLSKNMVCTMCRISTSLKSRSRS